MTKNIHNYLYADIDFKEVRKVTLVNKLNQLWSNFKARWSKKFGQSVYYVVVITDSTLICRHVRNSLDEANICYAHTKAERPYIVIEIEKCIVRHLAEAETKTVYVDKKAG